MTDIAHRLDDYALLPADERAEVDAYVEAHPEWLGRWEEARSTAAFFDTALDPPDPAAAAVDARLRPSSPGAERTLDARLTERLRMLEASVEDPARQFERLTGRALPPLDAASPAAVHRLADRAPAAAARRSGSARHVLRWAAAIALVAYGGLWAASTATVPERARVADLGAVDAYRSPTLRGDEADLPRQVDAALEGVVSARRTSAGLFPRFDAKALDEAAAELAAVARQAPAGSAASETAYLALGRVRLHQGRDLDATRLFEAVLRAEGYRAPEARRYLDWIRAQER